LEEEARADMADKLVIGMMWLEELEKEKAEREEQLKIDALKEIVKQRKVQQEVKKKIEERRSRSESVHHELIDLKTKIDDLKVKGDTEQLKDSEKQLKEINTAVIDAEVELAVAEEEEKQIEEEVDLLSDLAGTGKKKAADVNKLELLKSQDRMSMDETDEIELITLKKACVEKVTLCEATFVNFDKDGDGQVTVAEVVQYLLSVRPKHRDADLPEAITKINPFRKKQVQKLLVEMDEDHDGKISFHEFATWWEHESQLDDDELVEEVGGGNVRYSHRQSDSEEKQL